MPQPYVHTIYPVRHFLLENACAAFVISDVLVAGSNQTDRPSTEPETALTNILMVPGLLGTRAAITHRWQRVRRSDHTNHETTANLRQLHKRFLTRHSMVPAS